MPLTNALTRIDLNGPRRVVMVDITIGAGLFERAHKEIIKAVYLKRKPNIVSYCINANYRRFSDCSILPDTEQGPSNDLIDPYYLKFMQRDMHYSLCGAFKTLVFIGLREFTELPSKTIKIILLYHHG